ncbi:putative heat shock protein 10 [Ramicandelaber brevisporus]|nr:putative heat shock protein 10 [Ramicandelaber brevisporus]
MHPTGLRAAAKRLIPLYDRVLVQRLKAQTQTASGIIIPEKAQETANEGTIVAVGTGLVDKDGKNVPMQLKEGDRVVLPSYGGSNVKVNGEEMLLFRESEILAKVQG